MIAEIGHFALIFALFVATAQAVVPMAGARRKNAVLMDLAPRAAIAQFVLVALSFAALIWCHVTDDFSVINVVMNSHTDKPMLYKIAGVWGNHEGSMVLWVFILALYGAAVALFGGNLPPVLRARALSVQAMISTGFILFIVFTSNPFLRVDPAPANGQGLNPILQDPGLAFHPPFLYLGYVGFSMAFSFAIAALIEGKADSAWARQVRPWIIAAWSFLTFGIAMGSWWAYYTLGWGGWWYWDPVENASFMPWLSGTALVHSVIVLERRNTLKAWTMLLTIVAFSFSLLGTFLVRSGVLTSVHSFAADPSRGVFILGLLAIAIGGAMLLFAIRAPALKSGEAFAPVSREGALLFNNVMMSVVAGAILLGTLYPLFLDVLGLGMISVGAPYFNMVFVPLMFVAVAVMAIAPALAWKHGSLSAALAPLTPAASAALVTFALVWAQAKSPGAAAALGLAVWLFCCVMGEVGARLCPHPMPLPDFLRRAVSVPRSFYGMALAHTGVAILIVGIAASTAWKVEKIQVMRVGDTVAVAGYGVTLKNVEEAVAGPNYTAERATFEAVRNGRVVAVLRPERRQFENLPMPTTAPAIHTNLLGDLYAVIGDADGKGGYVTRLYYNPLVPWIFIGASIIAIGGFVSLSSRGKRHD